MRVSYARQHASEHDLQTCAFRAFWGLRETVRAHHSPLRTLYCTGCSAAGVGAASLLRNGYSGLCLVAVGCSNLACAASLQPPTQLVMGPCDAAQGALLFQENTDGTLRALDSNLCLEHPPCDLGSGACNGIRTQVGAR